MKEHPILMSTDMVRAILAGNKTQTRRVVKMEFDDLNLLKKMIKCPYGQPGDILWVRETFCRFDTYTEILFAFKATQQTKGKVNWKPSIHMPKASARIWLQIEDIRVERLHQITEEDIKSEGVRIPINPDSKGVLLLLGEKNKAIDFLPEGCLAKDAPKLTQAQLMFAHWAELQCNVNGRESWDANPWVWVIKFKVLSTTGRPEFSNLQITESSNQ